MRNRNIKYVIFDFDGTLADSGPVALNAINRMSGKLGYEKLDWKQVEKLRGMTVKERSKYMGVPLYKMPFIAPDFYIHYKEEMSSMGLNSGIGELLEHLNEKGYGMAVISSNSEHNIKEFLDKKNIDVFSDVLCSKHIFSKDTIIKKFLKRKKLDTTQVIYIGDETRDIKACKKVGVSIIWVDWGLDKKEAAEQYNPDYMVSDTGEIREIISSLEG